MMCSGAAYQGCHFKSMTGAVIDTPIDQIDLIDSALQSSTELSQDVFRSCRDGLKLSISLKQDCPIGSDTC